MRVLVVDDSVVHRSQIKKALDSIPGVEVAGSASNGRSALKMIEQGSFELVTLDLNMPEMGGLQLLSELGSRGRRAPNIIVFATATANHERERREAMHLGAHDFILKPVNQVLDFDQAYTQLANELVPRVTKLMHSQASKQTAEKTVPKSALAYPSVDIASFQPAAIAVASSTGGPEALENLLRNLPKQIDVPIFIAQHMPPPFTQFLAQRLASISGTECREGKDGEIVQNGVIYVAPADYHMSVVRQSNKLTIALDQGAKVNGVRPAADILFSSVALAYGRYAMAFVLTGMGKDGCLGAQHIKQAGGAVMIQNKESSVVWGMPGAVFASHAFDKMGSIEDCATTLSKMCARKRSHP